MNKLYVRVSPKSGLTQFYRCAILFALAWALIEVDESTKERLEGEQMLETSETEPEGYLPPDELAAAEAEAAAAAEAETTKLAEAETLISEQAEKLTAAETLVTELQTKLTTAEGLISEQAAKLTTADSLLGEAQDLITEQVEKLATAETHVAELKTKLAAAEVPATTAAEEKPVEATKPATKAAATKAKQLCHLQPALTYSHALMRAALLRWLCQLTATWWLKTRCEK